jgi:hypothetical protein
MFKQHCVDLIAAFADESYTRMNHDRTFHSGRHFVGKQRRRQEVHLLYDFHFSRILPSLHHLHSQKKSLQFLRQPTCCNSVPIITINSLHVTNSSTCSRLFNSSRTCGTVSPTPAQNRQHRQRVTRKLLVCTMGFQRAQRQQLNSQARSSQLPFRRNHPTAYHHLHSRLIVLKQATLSSALP